MEITQIPGQRYTTTAALTLREQLGSPKPGLTQPSPDDGAESLLALIAAEGPKLFTGRVPTISMAEGAWLVMIGEHPAAKADPRVGAKLFELTQGRTISRTAMEAGLGSYLEGLSPTTSSNNFENPTIVAVGDGGNDGNVANSAHNVVSVLTGANRPAQVPTFKRPVIHSKKAPIFVGDWRLSSDALEQYNKPKYWGSCTVKLSGTKKLQVHDQCYDVGGGEAGIRLMPTSDNGTVIDENGQEVAGHVVIDKFLRQEQGLNANDPIFTFIAYSHPEEHKGTLADLARSSVKPEMAFTHMGVYRGDGLTTNSPGGYHGNRWSNEGYPATVYTLSLDGVDQGTLNRNLAIVDDVLNNRVEFPADYKNDKFRTNDLNTNLMFFRDWVRDASYLHEDNSWATYCAEHKTIVANVGLNLPMNEDSFKEVYGDEGANLWSQFKTVYKRTTGKRFTPDMETHFEPLWKKEGLTVDQIRPFADLDAYQAYQTAFLSSTVDAYNGFKPVAPGQGMVWPPETSVDLIKNFVETYAPFTEAGGFVQAGTIMGFKDEIVGRMHISVGRFLELAKPLISKIMIAEAMADANDVAWIKQATAHLYGAFGGDVEAMLAGGAPNANLMGLVESCLEGVKAALPKILQDGRKKRAEAHAWLRQNMVEDIVRAQREPVGDEDATMFYSPPAVLNRILAGIHPCSKHVTLRAVCTAVDSEELQRST